MANQILLGQTATIAVTASDPSFMTNVVVFKDGVATLVGLSSNLVRTGLYQISFIPISTGFYEIAVEDKIYYLEVVRKSTYSLIEDIYDFTLGSWKWNKLTGVLETIRTSGTKLGEYLVKDTSDEASREKIG